jgi:hypothetical protein
MMSWKLLISALVAFFHPIDERSIHDLIAARGRVVAGKVPVSGVLRAGNM